MKRSLDQCLHDNDNNEQRSGSAAGHDDVVTLNVGGTLHSTTRHLLVNSADYFPHSLLAKMFACEPMGGSCKPDSEGHYFIDADWTVFRHILQVLRRPSLVRDVPYKLSAEAWCCELDYWGLVPLEAVTGASLQRTGGQLTPSALRTLQDGSSDNYSYESMTLGEIGAAIKKQIMDNELLVVRTLLQATGYWAQGGKTRAVVLRVPVGKYALPWGADMGAYLRENSKCMTALLCDMLGLRPVKQEDGHVTYPITIHESKTPKNHVEFPFNGRAYSTQEATVSVTITFSDLPTLQHWH